MMIRWRFCQLLAAAGLIAIAAGCESDTPAAKTEMPAPMVTVASPTPQTVQKFEYFTGRVEAPESVEIRAQVSGYLIKVLFKPGSVVQQGEPLFEIDPAPFAVELEKAEASLALSEARDKQAAAELSRQEELRKSGAGSPTEYDQAVANKLETAAMIKSSNAQIAGAKLNLEYTKITAPITGQIGDRLVTVGNLVAGGAGTTTLLTTIVSIDPMFIAFDVDELTIQRLRAAEQSGELKVIDRGAFMVNIGLSVHGTDYPLDGQINFANNQFDPKTGTVRVKAAVANPEPKLGLRQLVPGMFARVRVPIGEPTEAMMVPESAILSDQGRRYIFVVGAENKAQRLDLEPGVRVNGMLAVKRVREPGQSEPRPLRADEKIIVTGVQRVRPGMIVDPKPAPTK